MADGQGNTIGGVEVEIGADPGPLRKAVQNIDKAFAPMRERLKSIGSALSTSLTLPIVGLGTVALQSAAKMDSLRRGLTAVAGSTEEAERQIVRLREVAKLPGLGFEEAIQGSINLQAAGFSAEVAERSLAAFGNALATVGKGRNELDGVILALGQIASKGKVSAEEINQIAERVPQIRQVMQDAFGTANTEELQKMGITANQFVGAVVTELEKLPPVTGGIQNQLENLQETASEAFRAIGEAIIPVVSAIADRALPIIENLTERFRALPDSVKQGAIVFAGLAAAIGPVALLLSAVLTPIGAVVAGIGAIAAAAVVLARNFDSLPQPLQNAFRSIGAVIDKVVAAVSGKLRSAFEALKDFWASWGDTITRIVGIAFEAVTTSLGNGLSLIVQGFTGLAQLLSGDVSGAFETFRGIAVHAMKTVATLVLDVFRIIITGLQAVLSKIPGIGERMAHALNAPLGVIEGLRGALAGPSGSGGGGVAGAIDAIGSAAGGVSGTLSSLFDGLTEGAFSSEAAVDKLRAKLAGLMDTGAGGAYLSDRYGKLFTQGILNDRGLDDVAARQASEARADMRFDVPGLVGMPTPEQIEAIRAKLDDVTEGVTRASVATAEWMGVTRGVSFAFAAGIGEAIGDTIYGVVSLQDGFKSLRETIISFGDMAREVMRRFIADISAAIAKAALLKAVGAIFGVSTGGFGFLVMQGLGFAQPALATASSSGLVSSSAVSGGAVRASQQAIAVRVVPTVLPSGDLLFAAGEGTRRQIAGVLG